MQVREFQRGALRVRIFSNRTAMGSAAGEAAAEAIRGMLARDDKAAAVFACAPSQNEFLAFLRNAPGIDWPKVTAFHMDEYVGLDASHPASFRRFLREHLVDRAPIGKFHELSGDAADPEAQCDRYSDLLRQEPPGLVALGIGENGHLAFIDPPVCDFHDPRDVRPVDLDEVCRMQQVHDGMFHRIEDVPGRAVSLTIPFFMRVPMAIVTVAGASKRFAVKAALEGPVSERCPASILRLHPNASLFLDTQSASLLTPGGM